MSNVALALPHAPPDLTPRSSQRRILLADDERDMCELVVAGLAPRGFRITACQTPDDAHAQLESGEFDAVVVDIHMEDKSGLELCRDIVAKHPDLPVVVMTGFGTMDHAVSAIRAGAYDFITKPVSMDALELTLDGAVRHGAMASELTRLRQRSQDGNLPKIVGRDGALRKMSELISRVAATDTNVLITGESGTGKELVARALHEQSGRQGAFLAINCAAMPENLLENELFGHARGAFTDAKVPHAGLFVEADGGTLFLDEIGEMPLTMQAKLLRALQERKVRPLGATQEVSFDARIVTATNRDLEQEVATKRFREDLFYRINVVRVDVPALRHRGNDVLELAQFFLDRTAKRSGEQVATIGRHVAERLLSYDWPGNVRELENCMERAAALARFNTLTVDDLPPRVRDHRSPISEDSSENPSEMPKMDVVEQRYVRKVLAAVRGNKTVAAKILGFDRRTLYRKLHAMESSPGNAEPQPDLV